MPVPEDPPAHPGHTYRVGYDIEPGIYESEGLADGFDSVTAHWEIFTVLGGIRLSSHDRIFAGLTGTNASQRISVTAGAGGDTLVLRWGSRTAYLPWNIAPADMQNNVDTLIAGITPFDPFGEDEPTPNNCTVTGTAGVSYVITYINDLAGTTPNPGLTLDYQASAGSTGFATITTTAATGWRPPIRDVNQVCLRNTDFVFEFYGFKPWTKVGPGVKDVYIRTRSGWTPTSRLPADTYVRSSRGISAPAPIWYRSMVPNESAGGPEILNLQTLHALDADNHWQDIGDFGPLDGFYNYFGFFYARPNIRTPKIFPCTWPSRIYAPNPTGTGSRTPGDFLVRNYAETTDGSDPAELAPYSIFSSFNTHAQSSWSQRWNAPSALSGHSDYYLVNRRYHELGALMVDHDWVLWVMDRLCQPGAAAYYYLDMTFSASVQSVQGTGEIVSSDLSGYNVHIRNCVPASIPTFAARLDYDGALPVTDIHSPGVVETTDRAVVPIVGDATFTARWIPGGDGGTTYDRRFFVLPFTPVAGGSTGLAFTVDPVPDGLVTTPNLNPHGDPLPANSAVVNADILAGVTFTQPGESLADWQAVKWIQSGFTPTGPGDWLLGPVTVLP